MLTSGYVLRLNVCRNMLLNYTGRPSIYLPVCMMIWGMISCLTGETKKYARFMHNLDVTNGHASFVGALLTRFFLGFIEAAFFPGALFLLSKWYTRKELGLRTALLSCGSLISNAFGSLIASGILDGMQDKLGHAAWRCVSEFRSYQKCAADSFCLVDGCSSSRAHSPSSPPSARSSSSPTSRRHRADGSLPLR